MVLEGWKATERVRAAYLWKGEVGAAVLPQRNATLGRVAHPPIKSVWWKLF